MAGTVARNRRESSQKVTGLGGALGVRNAGAESVMVEFDKESLASERLLEEVLEKENLERALRRVKRYRELQHRGVRPYTAWVTTKSGRDPWRLSNSPAVLQGLPAQVLSSRLWLKYICTDNNRTAHYGPVR